MSNPYEVYLVTETVDEFLYQFTCNSGIIYNISFKKVNYLFIETNEFNTDIYDISFFPIQEGNINHPFDIRISQTLKAAISQFIINNEVPVIYICDSTDGRPECRNKLFTRWFNGHNNENNLFQHGYITLEFDDYNLIAGLICNANDPSFNSYFAQVDKGLLEKGS